MDYHQPVLLEEVISNLEIEANSIYVDATLGNGGHTLAILKLGAIVFGIDQDPKNLEISTQKNQRSWFF